MQRQNGFDQTRHAGRGNSVPNVAFCGTDFAELFLVGPSTKHFLQRGYFDRIANQRRCAVGLDISNALSINVSMIQRHRNRAGLSVDAWGGETGFAAAVVVDAVSANDGVDVVALFNGVVQSFDNNRTGTVAEQSSGGVCVEGSAVTIGREDVAFLVKVALVLRELHRRSTSDRGIAVTGRQRGAGLDDRDQ